MFSPTIDQVHDAYERKGYKFFNSGDYDLNIYGIRMDNVYDNEFSDPLGIIYPLNKKMYQIQIPGTTCPGLYGGHAVMNPRPEGVAVMVPGQYLRLWEFIDSYDGWLNYPYMHQIGKVRLYRDGNKDTILDPVKESEYGPVGINMHRMSGIDKPGKFVNNWSEACIGAIEPEFKKFLPIFREATKKWGNRFSFTLFEKKDFDV